MTHPSFPQAIFATPGVGSKDNKLTIYQPSNPGRGARKARYRSQNARNIAIAPQRSASAKLARRNAIAREQEW
jgi:hypothetical protein